MGAESLGSAVLDLTADPSQLLSTIAGARKKVVSEWAETGKSSKLAMAGAMAAVGVAVGVGLFKVGEKFDAAYDTIRTNTGKTGKELEKLKDNFRNVIKDVPASFDDASFAVAELNKRLGLTGKPLEERSKQFLELSRITGEDLRISIRNITRLFGDWSISVARQGPTMDRLFRLSQFAGIGLNDLSGLMVQFGSPLRQLGIDFDTAAAMFARFEREGVNIQTLMPGLKMGLKNLSQPTRDVAAILRDLGVAGRDPDVALRAVMRSIRDARSTLEANGIAFDVFGARAGPDMAAAIREGRFSLEDYIGSMHRGNETIMGAGEQTMDFSERLEILKNRGLLAIEGPAIFVLDAMTDLADALLWLSGVVDRMPGPVLAFIGVLIGSAGLFIALNKIVGAVDVLARAMMANPYIALAAATIAIAILIIKHWDAIKTFFVGVWDAIKNTVREGLDWLKNHIGTVMPIIMTLMMGPLGGFLAYVITHWSRVKRAFQDGLDAVIDALDAAVRPFRNAGEALGKAIVNGIRALFGLFRSAGEWTQARIMEGFRTVGNLLATAGEWIKNRIVEIVHNTIDSYHALGSWVLARVMEGFRTVINLLGNAGEWLKDRIVGVVHNEIESLHNLGSWVLARVMEGVRTVGDLLAGVGEWLRARVSGFVKAASDGFKAIGSNIIDWIMDGLKEGAIKIQDFLNTIIHVINKLPGVDIPDIRVIRRAEGGLIGRDMIGFASGGSVHQGMLLNSPLIMMGEEAPQHPEYIIPTNPAYRKRALSLLFDAAEKLGYADGGVVQAFDRAIVKANAGPRAALALFEAGIVESGLRNLTYGDLDSTGALQVRASTAAPMGINPMNPGQVAMAFLQRGYWGKGGAMSLAARYPSATEGWIAQNVQGSAYPDRYDAVRNQALSYVHGGPGTAGGIGDTFSGLINKILGELPNPVNALPNWAVGLGRYVIERITGWVKAKAGDLIGNAKDFLVGDEGSLTGGLMWSFIDQMAGRYGLTMSSGYRPGDDGLHGVHRAKDWSNGWATPQELGFAATLAGSIGNKMSELIHTPLGYGIKDGKKVGLDFWGAATNADHFDHTHTGLPWAYAQGGIISSLPFAGHYGGGGWVSGPRGRPMSAIVHGGEHIGSGAPTVVVKFANGMGWLKDFVTVEIEEHDRSSKLDFDAGVTP